MRRAGPGARLTGLQDNLSRMAMPANPAVTYWIHVPLVSGKAYTVFGSERVAVPGS